MLPDLRGSTKFHPLFPSRCFFRTGCINGLPDPLPVPSHRKDPLAPSGPDSGDYPTVYRRFIPGQLNWLANGLTSFACAMQVQSFRTVRGSAYASTMCIGNLRSGMDHFYKAITEKRKDELKTAAIYLTAIGSFTIGAACGGHLTNHFSYRTIWISCGLLILCFLLMLIEEEDDLEAVEKRNAKS